MIGTTNFDQPLKEADLLFECHFCKKQTIPLPKAFVFFSSNKSNSLSLFHQMIHHCMDNDQQKSYRATKNDYLCNPIYYCQNNLLCDLPPTTFCCGLSYKFSATILLAILLSEHLNSKCIGVKRS